MEVTGAELVMETDKPGKLPLEFQIARLNLTGIASGNAMGFDAELTNPKPKGTIKTKGSFGPWKTADPGESPLAGDYRLEHADLATFKEIAGTLDSTGHFQGTLRDLTVDGQTRYAGFPADAFWNSAAARPPASTRGWTGPTGIRGWSRWMRRWAVRTLPRRGRLCASRSGR